MRRLPFGRGLLKAGIASRMVLSAQLCPLRHVALLVQDFFFLVVLRALLLVLSLLRFTPFIWLSPRTLNMYLYFSSAGPLHCFRLCWVYKTYKYPFVVSLQDSVLWDVSTKRFWLLLTPTSHASHQHLADLEHEHLGPIVNGY